MLVTVTISALLLMGYVVFQRLGRRSGVTDADLQRKLPGDQIIKNVSYIADRSAVIPAPVEEVWPYIVQLGKERAGWYAPQWLENIFVWNPKKRIKRSIQPKYQRLKVGDVVPDWGPGSLQVLEIHRKKYLLYGAIHPKDTKGEYFFSWVHTLEKIDTTSCRVYTRLRIRKSDGLFNALMFFGGVFDWATIIAMYAGLKEILKR